MAEDENKDLPPTKGRAIKTSGRTRPSRSRCFKVYKYLLLTALIAYFIATLASTPWCVGLSRDILQTLNTTSMAQMYSGQEPLILTDTLVYATVGVALLFTFVWLLFGLIGVWKECFFMVVTFGVSLLLFFAGSICFFDVHLLVLINLIVDIVLGLIVLIFAILIKRADRLAPQPLSPDDISKPKGKKGEEAECLTEGGDGNERV